MKTKILIAMV